MRRSTTFYVVSLALVVARGLAAAFVVSPNIAMGSRVLARGGLRKGLKSVPLLTMSTGSVEDDEINAIDKALIAWGVKAPPGEPEVDVKEKIKSAGLAGALAYGGTELAFWLISIPLAVFGYYQTTGEWLDLTSLEGKEKLFGLTAGFLTFARLVVPLRIALALALTPAADKYVVKPFFKKGDGSTSISEAAMGDAGSGFADKEAADVAQKALSETAEVPTREELEMIGSIRRRLRDAETKESSRRLRERLNL